MADWRSVLRHYRLLAPVRLVVGCGIVLVTLSGLVMWMTLFLPLLWLKPEAYWKIGRFFRDTGFGLKGTIWWFLGYNVAEVGNVVDELLGDRSLFLVNHQSMLDGPTLTAMVGQKGITDSCAFMIDAWMKFTTYYGYYASFGGDLFVQQSLPDDKRKTDLENVRRQLQYMFNGPAQRKWMLYFPEGGLLRKRRPRSKAFAVKYGHPVLEHVALPRIGAMQTMLEALSPSLAAENHTTSVQQHGHDTPDVQQPANDTSVQQHANDTTGVQQAANDTTSVQQPANDTVDVQQPAHGSDTAWKWIVDATVAYPEGIPLAVSDLVTGARAPCLITVCYRVYPAAEVPRDTEGLQKWVFQRFVEKDAMLEHFYKHGCFPEEYMTRDSSVTVRHQPQLVSWNCWAASLGLAVTSLIQFWTGYKVWSYLFYLLSYPLICFLR